MRKQIPVKLFAIAAALVAAVSAFVQAQELPYAATLERLATVVTELDPGVKNLEMRGRISPLADSDGMASYFFRYQAPDRYTFFLSRAGDRAAYAAAAGKRVVLYDIKRGGILQVEGAFPYLQIMVKDNSLRAGWGLTDERRKAAEPGTPQMVIDFASMFKTSETSTHVVERLGNGRYRLIRTGEKNIRVVATVDPSSRFPFSGLEVFLEGRAILTLDLRVNVEALSAVTPVPTAAALGKHFKFVQEPPPNDVQAALRVVGLTFLPLALAEPVGGKQDSRKFMDTMLSEKHDWRALNAAYQRDLPNLLQLLPMPQ